MRAIPALSEHFSWLEQRNHFTAPADFRAVEVQDDAGFTRAMAGFSCWAPNSVQLTLFADSPIALKALLPALFDYAFRECDRRILLAIAPSHSPLCPLALKAGFREICRVTDGHAPGDDLVLFEMRREACRWLSEQQEVA